MCQIIHKTRTIFCVLFIDVRTLIHQCHDTWLEYFSVSMNTSLWHLASCLSGPEQCQVLTRSIDLCFRAKKFLEQSYVFRILRFLRNIFLIEDPLSPTMQTWKNGLLGSISPASTNPTHCSPVYLSGYSCVQWDYDTSCFQLYFTSYSLCSIINSSANSWLFLNLNVSAIDWATLAVEQEHFKQKSSLLYSPVLSAAEVLSLVTFSSWLSLGWRWSSSSGVVRRVWPPQSLSNHLLREWRSVVVGRQIIWSWWKEFQAPAIKLQDIPLLFWTPHWPKLV